MSRAHDYVCFERVDQLNEALPLYKTEFVCDLEKLSREVSAKRIRIDPVVMMYVLEQENQARMDQDSLIRLANSLVEIDKNIPDSVFVLMAKSWQTGGNGEAWKRSFSKTGDMSIVEFFAQCESMRDHKDECLPDFLHRLKQKDDLNEKRRTQKERDTSLRNKQGCVLA